MQTTFLSDPLSRRRSLRRLAALACATTAAPLVHARRRPAASYEVDAVQVASGFELPWSLAFLPDRRMLVTERPGRLRLVQGSDVSEPLHGVPRVDHRDHGGLLDVLPDPGFESNRLLYLSYTEAGRLRSQRNGLAVARARLREDERGLEDVLVIFRQVPKTTSGENLGGRMAVDPGGHLFLTIGDGREDQERVKAQDLRTHHGKVVRIRTDGRVPRDNPFVGQSGARREIWSLGHRNPQGILLHPVTGELWTCEHGPQGGDEVNITRPGRNYGWPLVSHGCEYDTCAPIGAGTHMPGLEPPLVHWGVPAIAPSSMLLYTGDRFPAWRGNLFLSTLAGMALWRLVLKGPPTSPRVVHREPLLGHLGLRLRDVQQGPDGGIYLLSDGVPGHVLRVEAVPA